MVHITSQTTNRNLRLKQNKKKIKQKKEKKKRSKPIVNTKEI